MTRYATKIDEILRRGGLVERDSDFVVVACTRCGRQHLYDEELLRIYSDPDDLSTSYFNCDSYFRPCPGCARADWDFDTLDLDSPQVMHGPWSWVR